MTQAVTGPRLTFEEYIDYCAQTDDRVELVHGELVKMTPPTWMHIRIARFLEQAFNAEIERINQNWEAFREPGQRTERDSSRLPDVVVVPVEAIASALNQTAILTVPSLLIVEIVSASSAADDYTTKLKEYEALQIPEYWIVDHEALGDSKHLGFPKQPTLTICSLDRETYQKQYFRGSDRITSSTFPELNLTAAQIFKAGR